jgi:hypothetical protein
VTRDQSKKPSGIEIEGPLGGENPSIELERIWRTFEPRAAAHFEFPARYKECSGTKFKLLKNLP